MLQIVREHRGSVYEAFKRNLRDAGVSSLVNPLVCSSIQGSKEFEPGSLSFVFIDACHTYKAVRSDILAWLPKVKTGGILAGHDIGTYRSVAEAVEGVLGSVRVKEKCWIYEKG